MIAIISIIALVLSSANLAFLFSPESSNNPLSAVSNKLEPIVIQSWSTNEWGQPNFVLENNNSIPVYNIELVVIWRIHGYYSDYPDVANGTIEQKTFIGLMPNETESIVWYPQTPQSGYEQGPLTEDFQAYGNTQPNEQNTAIPQPSQQNKALPSPSPTLQGEQGEQGQVTNLQFSTAPQSVLITFNNTGTTTITLTQLWVNNVQYTPIPALGAVTGNSGIQYNVTMSITSGYQYSVVLESAEGNKFTSTGTAPT
jgi:hypothetical protein